MMRERERERYGLFVSAWLSVVAHIAHAYNHSLHHADAIAMEFMQTIIYTIKKRLAKPFKAET